MVNRSARNRLAELARHLAEGGSNDEVEDRAWLAVEASEGDLAVRVVVHDLCSLSSGYFPGLWRVT